MLHRYTTVRTLPATNAPTQAEGQVSPVVAAVACDSTAYDEIEREVASAIHNNHSSPPGFAVPCFLCRRDARAVLHRLGQMGYNVVVSSAALLAASQIVGS